jgi:CubicO group peptidase (beta-lactamase class C family)
VAAPGLEAARRTAALVLGLWLLPCPGARAACDVTGLRPRVDALFAAFSKGTAPGATIGVVCDGRLVLQAAYGYADIARRQRNTPATVFHVASVGKQMTAVAILLLQQDGALSLDDPVTRHVPALGSFAKAVTLRQLLQHTGGIPDTYDELESRGGAPTNADAVALLREWHRLDFKPGARHDYSNSGYDLLGSVIESVSRQSFADFMRTRVFEPAGMTSTFAIDPRRWRSGARAHGYVKDGRRFTLDDESALNGIHGSGSIVTSVVDLARYDRALFGGSLLSAKSLAALVEPARIAGKRRVPYGLGWELGTTDGRSWIGHSGGWMGFSSYYLRYPADGAAVFVLSNDASADTEALATAVGAWVTASPHVSTRDGTARPRSQRQTPS